MNAADSPGAPSPPDPSPHAWWNAVDDPALDTAEAATARVIELFPGAPRWLADLTWVQAAETEFRVADARTRLATVDPPALPPRWRPVVELLRLRLDVREGAPARLAQLRAEIEAMLASLPAEETATAARALHLLGALCIRRGEMERAEEALADALAGASDCPARTLWIIDGFAQVFQEQGAWQEARRTLLALVERKRAAGDALGVAISAGHLSRLELDLGSAAAAAQIAREALSTCGAKLGDVSRLRLQTLLVQACLEGDDDEAPSREAVALEALYARAGDRGGQLGGYAALALARAAARRGDRAGAAGWLAAASARFTMPAQLAFAEYHRARIFPEALAEPGWWEKMQGLFRDAGGASEAEVRTHLLLAERAASAQGPDEARAHLARAEACARRANHRIWVELIDRAAARIDPAGMAERLVVRFSGRTLGELSRTVTEEATIVFADLVNFTLRSQELPPAEVMQTSRSLFELTVPLMDAFKVRPLTYMGDGLLAVCEGEGHTGRGLAFARALVRRAARATRVRRALGNRWGLDLRAGAASGPVVMGTLGTLFKLEFAAIGRTTNLAARLQSQAQPGEVVCAYETASPAERTQAAREELFELKGFPERVRAVRFRAGD